MILAGTLSFAVQRECGDNYLPRSRVPLEELHAGVPFYGRVLAVFPT